MEIGLVKQIDIEHEVKESYLSYAMSVIVSQALPDARDGLKPVQRRILYAMYDMGLRPDTPIANLHALSAKCWANIIPTATNLFTTRWSAWPKISPCAPSW